MNIINTVQKADEYMAMRRPFTALELYFSVINYFRRNKKRLGITK